VADAVALNAAAALAAYAGLTGDVTADLRSGLRRARAAMTSGAVTALVERWTTVSQELAAAG
jgi:anthranilate phosphoribosyltransferase